MPRGVPRVLKPRLILGDPIWRELPVRNDLQTHYDRIWQTAVDTALEHNFEIATMDKSSGYLRTIPKIPNRVPSPLPPANRTR